MLNPSELADGVKIPKSQPPNPASNSVLLFDEVPSNLASNEIDKNSLSGSIWTVSNGTKNPSRLTTSTVMDDDRSTIEDEKDPVEGNEFYDDDDDDESVPDTKIIFDKEFEDYFEDRIHKSGSSMIFMSKTLGLLPVIWTEEDLEGECKTYLNFYTFILYICWVALFVLTFIKLNVSTEWPSDTAFQHYMNKTNNGCVVLSSATFQANLGGQWISAILIVSCGILNSRSLADVFYSLSGVDSS
ncbi:uncharacterized protein [Lepeophtheirus salmonis]|uniref:uncharacterized protein isoform X1 n=1 Tax=Lepeophtheirus salmonis TaxID=72036 RepID=UPI001AE93DB7|nr:uncharacterized protein LOC121123484 isoform X1 [Lepeophtheirus salmonis]